MTVRAYQRQHLAAVAAGSINGAGTTRVGIGCSLTRIGTGQYGVVLPDDYGVQDRQTFTCVTIKTSTERYKTVTDTSNTLKTIRTFDTSPVAADSDIEVIIFRSVESGR